jgi:peptidoglycan/xylan/chitin deacetylase (PgdA/CDA1 family)
MREVPLFRTLCFIVNGLLIILLMSAVVAAAAAVVQFDDEPLPASSTDWVHPIPAGDCNALKQTNLPQPPSQQPSATPISASTEHREKEKVVYLTFDDGPELENTPRILEILKQHNIRATFFVIGTQIEAYPEILRRIHAEGHAIGNHSYNHRYNELYQSADAYIAQLQKTDALIETVVGFKPVVTRAPGGTTGSFTNEYWHALKRCGYREFGWNISSGDASSARASQIGSNVIKQAQQKHLWPKAIVLMHDGTGHWETVLALPQIIEYFKQNGFDFQVVDQSTPDPW